MAFNFFQRFVRITTKFSLCASLATVAMETTQLVRTSCVVSTATVASELRIE